MKLLITGATGLIGRHLVEALGERHTVHALHRPDMPPGQADVHWTAADLADRAFVDGLPPDGVDSVIHLAQSRRFRDFPEGARDVFAVNVDSTSALLDWSVRTGVRQFILASSGGIYGHGRDPFTEEHPIGSSAELGHYLASKHSAELLGESYASHITVVIVRFFFVYGPGQQTGMLIPRLVQSVAEGRSILLRGANGLCINPVHVADAAAAIRRALNLEQSHKINVGGPEILSLREIAESIGVRLGRSPRYTVESDALPRDLIADIGKMKRLLASPRVRFADGCEDVIRDLGLSVNGL